MDKQEILDAIGDVQAVHDYLRGIEPGSEADRDAMRAMRAAIDYLRGGGVHDVMATVAPDLYGDTCLAYCQLRTDADAALASVLRAQIADGIAILRSDSKNIDDNKGE